MSEVTQIPEGTPTETYSPFGRSQAAVAEPMPAPHPGYGGASTSAPTPDFLLGVKLNVSVEVGRVQMPVRQVMELGPGAVIELQRGASEPVEIFANGRCIGRGEIVVVGEQFGVRVTELGASL